MSLLPLAWLACLSLDCHARPANAPSLPRAGSSVMMSVKTKTGARGNTVVPKDPLVIPADYRVPAGFVVGETKERERRGG